MQTNSILVDDKNNAIPVANNSSHKATLALKDFKDGALKWRTWLLLASQDIRLRYRRSVLGPFWLTLSMAITVYSMGFLYGHLFQTQLNEYFPYLVAGMVAWSLLSTNINELTDTFMQYESLLKEVKLPYTLHINRVAMRNMLIFLHNIIVIIPVYLFFPHNAAINLCSLFLIFSLFLVYVSSVFFGLFLAMISSRFRDISQLIKNIVQVVFFITPVIWNPAVLPKNKIVFVSFNPVYPFIEMIRQPLLGHIPPADIIIKSIVITLLTILISFTVFARYRSRIIYWL